MLRRCSPGARRGTPAQRRSGRAGRRRPPGRPGARPAPADHTLHDQTGRLFSLASLRGHTVAHGVLRLPTARRSARSTGAPWRAAERRCPRRSARSWSWSASTRSTRRPARARPSALGPGAARRLALAAGHPRRSWPGLERVPHLRATPMDGDISHTEALYLIDRRGYERSGYLYPFPPAVRTPPTCGCSNERRAGMSCPNRRGDDGGRTAEALPAAAGARPVRAHGARAGATT